MRALQNARCQKRIAQPFQVGCKTWCPKVHATLAVGKRKLSVGNANLKTLADGPQSGRPVSGAPARFSPQGALSGRNSDLHKVKRLELNGRTTPSSTKGLRRRPAELPDNRTRCLHQRRRFGLWAGHSIERPWLTHRWRDAPGLWTILKTRKAGETREEDARALRAWRLKKNKKRSTLPACKKQTESRQRLRKGSPTGQTVFFDQT
jgi:hypothetical protein